MTTRTIKMSRVQQRLLEREQAIARHPGLSREQVASAIAQVRGHSSAHWAQQRPRAPPVHHTPRCEWVAPELDDDSRWDFSDDDEPSRLIQPNPLVPKHEIVHLAHARDTRVWHKGVLALEEAHRRDRATVEHMDQMRAWLVTRRAAS